MPPFLFFFFYNHQSWFGFCVCARERERDWYGRWKRKKERKGSGSRTFFTLSGLSNLGNQSYWLLSFTANGPCGESTKMYSKGLSHSLHTACYPGKSCFLSFLFIFKNSNKHLERVYKFGVFPICQIEPLAILHLDILRRRSRRGFLAVLVPIVPPYED